MIATREEFGDKLRRFATYSYRKGYEYDSLEVSDRPAFPAAKRSAVSPA